MIGLADQEGSIQITCLQMLVNLADENNPARSETIFVTVIIDASVAYCRSIQISIKRQ